MLWQPPLSAFETRSLPTLTRSYPRRFAFYVARPARSIQFCISAAPAAFDRYLAASPAMSLIHFAPFSVSAFPGIFLPFPFFAAFLQKKFGLRVRLLVLFTFVR